MTLKPNELLKLARKTRQFTQDEVSEQYGCSVSTYKRWENGQIDPPYTDVHGILDMLGFTVRELEDDNSHG